MISSSKPRFIIRSVTDEDAEPLFRLSKLVSFLNLPQDLDIIKAKIKTSIKSFDHPHKDLSRNYYFFAIENIETKEIIGTSMIHAKHGTETEPNFYLKVGQEHKFSTTINTGFVHGTLKLNWDTDGPTEIGALVLNPEYRGHPLKIGKQLSFVRFLYMAMFPDRFKEEVHSELMPPLDKKGNSAIWEAIGRKFMNMEYQSADLLSQKNKEFILNLFPSDTIYVTMLPIEARNAIGEVGPSTKPVKKMLEDIGFYYSNEVDPFDGGPHYRAKLKNISIVRNMKKIDVKLKSKTNTTNENLSLFTIPSDKYAFCACFGHSEETAEGLILSEESYKEFDLPKNFKSNYVTTG